MEIRNVVYEVKNEYPKMKQVSKRNLSNNIPSKWLKMGLSSIVITMIMKNKVFATTLGVNPDPYIATAGALPTPISMPIKICNIVCPIVQIVSLVVFIITGCNMLITKIKSKKQPEHKEVKKWVKFLFIISIIVFILSILTRFIIDVIY